MPHLMLVASPARETTAPAGQRLHVFDDALEPGIGADGDVAILRAEAGVSLHERINGAWEPIGRSLVGPSGPNGEDGKPTLRTFADRAALDAQKVDPSEPILPNELVEVVSYDGTRALVRCEYDAGGGTWTDRVWSVGGAMSGSSIVSALDAELGIGWKATGTGEVAVSATLAGITAGDYDLTGLMPTDARVDHAEISVFGGGTADLELILATADLGTLWPLGGAALWPKPISGALTTIDLTGAATNRHVFGRGADSGEPRRLLARFSNVSGITGDVDLMLDGIAQTAVSPSESYPSWVFEQDFDALADGTFDAGASGMIFNGTPQVGDAYGRAGKGVRCNVSSGSDRIHYAMTNLSEVWGRMDFRVQATAARTITWKLCTTRISASNTQAMSVILTTANQIALGDFAGTPPTLGSTFTVTANVWHTLKYGARLSATPGERAFYLSIQAEGSGEVVLFDGLHGETDLPGEISRWMVGSIANGVDTVSLPVDVDNYKIQYTRPATFLVGS